MKKSLCVSWISSCDYPLFRLWLRKYGSWFDEIIIYFDVQFRHPFFWAFVQQDLSTLSNIKFLDPIPYEYGVGDWRNTATNELINHATGDWIFSIEQDWFCKNWDQTLAKVEESMQTSDLIGWMNPTNSPYIHPAFFGIKRDMLERTSKDFSPHPEINGGDHFCQVTYDVQKLGGKIVSLQDMGFNCDFKPEADMFHLGSVNQHYLNGLTEGFQFHRPEAFMTYNFESRQIDIPQDPRFLGLSQDIEVKLLNDLNMSPRGNQWTPFFKL
ncbi:MAG: hypothetical protein C5B43_04165 [Verrucomicrobia bacterium]|nr:MAG: hypothetical protein C5B43_04165 [Verrucomicrobiota bacterium]